MTWINNCAKEINLEPQGYQVRLPCRTEISSPRQLLLTRQLRGVLYGVLPCQPVQLRSFEKGFVQGGASVHCLSNHLCCCC